MDRKSQEEISTILGGEAEFEGKLIFEGTVRVDGKFTGSFQSTGMLIIGERATVRAEIQVGVVLVHGEVHGTIHAQSRIEAYSPARIYADIYSPIFVLGEGVVFEGISHMTEDLGETGNAEHPGPQASKD